MSAKIEAGKRWIVSQQFGELGKGILHSGPLPCPVNIDSQTLKLYGLGSAIEVSSNAAYSIVKGHLPDEVEIKGQVLYHAISPKYGISTFVLIGIGAAIRFGRDSDSYLKVENYVDLSGERIS